jgi:hypothetical protein
MSKKVEIAIRIDGNESFYVLPDTFDPPSQDMCHGLDAEVDAVIRTTTNVQKTEWNIIRLLVATASRRADNVGRLEILIDDDGQPAIVNPETGQITQL